VIGVNAHASKQDWAQKAIEGRGPPISQVPFSDDRALPKPDSPQVSIGIDRALGVGKLHGVLRVLRASA